MLQPEQTQEEHAHGSTADVNVSLSALNTTTSDMNISSDHSAANSSAVDSIVVVASDGLSSHQDAVRKTERAQSNGDEESTQPPLSHALSAINVSQPGVTENGLLAVPLPRDRANPDEGGHAAAMDISPAVSSPPSRPTTPLNNILPVASATSSVALPDQQATVSEQDVMNFLGTVPLGIPSHSRKDSEVHPTHPAASGGIGPEMTVISARRGASSSATLSFSFDLNSAQTASLYLWQNRKSLPE